MLNNDSYERRGRFLFGQGSTGMLGHGEQNQASSTDLTGILGIAQDRRVCKSISLGSCAHRGWDVGIGIG
jgi:hypothetical protein